MFNTTNIYISNGSATQRAKVDAWEKVATVATVVAAVAAVITMVLTFVLVLLALQHPTPAARPAAAPTPVYVQHIPAPMSDSSMPAGDSGIIGYRAGQHHPAGR